MSFRIRKNEFKIRLTDDELNFINKKIAESKMNRREYILYLAKTGKIINDSEWINKIATELIREGNNLNQITRTLNIAGADNITPELQKEIRKTAERMDDVWQQLKRYLAEASKQR